MSDDSAAAACDLGGTVGRVVVVDVDGRLGQLAMKIIDHFADSQSLVIAGNNDRNIVSNHWLRPLFDIQIGARNAYICALMVQNLDMAVGGIDDVRMGDIGR